MSKFDDLLLVYKKCFEEVLHREDVNLDLLRSIAKSLGPSIYRKDASMVSCTSPQELRRVKESFLIKKLGLENSEELDQAIREVCETFGTSNRSKYRVVFYYLLVEKLGQEHFFIPDYHNVQITHTSEVPADEQVADHNNAESITNDDDNPEAIIYRYALYAAGAGFIPLPVIDLASISAIQYKMIKSLAKFYGKDHTNNEKTKSSVAALMGGLTSFELGFITRLIFRRIPLIGPVIGGTAMSGYAYVTTKLIGEIFNDHFKGGGSLSLEERTIIKMRETLRINLKNTTKG